MIRSLARITKLSPEQKDQLFRDVGYHILNNSQVSRSLEKLEVTSEIKARIQQNLNFRLAKTGTVWLNNACLCQDESYWSSLVKIFKELLLKNPRNKDLLDRLALRCLPSDFRIMLWTINLVLFASTE